MNGRRLILWAAVLAVGLAGGAWLWWQAVGLKQTPALPQSMSSPPGATTGPPRAVAASAPATLAPLAPGEMRTRLQAACASQRALSLAEREALLAWLRSRPAPNRPYPGDEHALLAAENEPRLRPALTNALRRLHERLAGANTAEAGWPSRPCRNAQ